MARRRPAALRLLARPVRRAFRLIEDLQRGRWHGPSRPRWWPRGRTWPLGPNHTHDGRQVTIFVGGQRYEFAPVTYGRRRGHMYVGRLRPTAAYLAERLAALALDPAEAPLLAAVSSLEGGFDSLQTYAQGRFAWGFLQFTGNGGLPALMQRLRLLEPDRFDRYFSAAGIGVAPGMLVIESGGRRLRGWRALNHLHDQPALWKQFLIASQDPAVRDVQVHAAYHHYLLRSRDAAIELGGRPYRLGDVLAGHPLGHAVLLDRAVEGGLTHVVRLFQRAARQVGAQSPAHAGQILAAARKLQAHNHVRWDALEAALIDESVQESAVTQR